jgi:hypothetical protein
VSVSEDQDAMVLMSTSHHCRVLLCGGGGWSWMSHWHFLWYNTTYISTYAKMYSEPWFHEAEV